MIICVCKCVSDSEIELAINSGSTTYESLQCSIGVGTQCGSCSCEVKELLQNAQKNATSPESKQEVLPVYGTGTDMSEAIRLANNM